MREVLAVPWKDKRNEINKAMLARNFKQVSEIKRSFGVDVEELKRRAKRNNCGKIGHWARECRAPKRPKDAPKPDATVTFIETFVGATDVYEVLLTIPPWYGARGLRLRQVRDRREHSSPLHDRAPEPA